MYGIGLFSAFMLADRLEVNSLRVDGGDPICWTAGEGTDIELSQGDRDSPGTSIRLYLKKSFHPLATERELIERSVKRYADFIRVPIYLNEEPARLNVIHSSWFDPTPDIEQIELDLASYFDEAPLDVIPVHVADPVALAGALYLTPQRTPGFADEAVVTVTINGMAISRQVRGLLPEWATFLRGVLELSDCSPTASREDLVRNHVFEEAALTLEELLFEHFERLVETQPSRWESILAWHRYSWAGAALGIARLRDLLAETYRFPTSQGQLTCREILERSNVDPFVESDFEAIVWYNTDRRQEAWLNNLFSDHSSPCVHTLRSFEESLLAAMIMDANAEGTIDLRLAIPDSPGFTTSVLGVSEIESLPENWDEFFAETEAVVKVASLASDQPALAFLNEKHELLRTFDDLKKQGSVPSGFQRMIDSHFADQPEQRHEVLLNRNHRLIQRALEKSTQLPLASVVRLLVMQSLATAGATLPATASTQQLEDLDWLAECLWGRDAE